MNISESLPSCSRIQCIASSEPSASPSGFSWVVSRSLSAARSSSTTWPSSVATCIPFYFQELADSHPSIYRLVVEELQGRSPLESQLGGDRPLQDAVGGAQARERRLPLILPTEHAHVNPGPAEVGARIDRRDGHEPDPGILESLGQANG